MAFTPSAPSEPVPLKITPMACAIMRRGKRAKEMIDRCPLPPLLKIRKAQMRVDSGKVAARRNHIDVIRLHRDCLVDLRDRHRHQRLKQLSQMAFMVGGEVHHYHEGDARILRNMLEKGFESRKPARRRA